MTSFWSDIVYLPRSNICEGANVTSTRGTNKPDKSRVMLRYTTRHGGRRGLQNVKKQCEFKLLKEVTVN